MRLKAGQSEYSIPKKHRIYDITDARVMVNKLYYRLAIINVPSMMEIRGKAKDKSAGRGISGVPAYISFHSIDRKITFYPAPRKGWKVSITGLTIIEF